MRVLCLHPAASSALQFSHEYAKLEERLWTKHGIELVFVDAPLLDVQIGKAVGADGGGINAIEEPGSSGGGDNSSGDEEERVSRRWYVEESSRGMLPPTTETSSSTQQPAVQYSGLDASLLHLSQIWSRGGANISNNTAGVGDCLPFQGVLGVGQGADVAGLLPLLNYHEDDDSDDEKENNDRVANSKPAMFQGMQFVVLIDGKDILCRGMNGDADDAHEENDIYVGPDGVQSLHVIMETNGNDSNDNQQKKTSSERLAKQYGPNAIIHHCKQPSCTPITPALSNILGKFLVAQKNRLHSNSQTRELIALQNQLSNVEQLATLAITQEVQRNPPKALMAVIGPAAMMHSDTAQDDAATDGTHIGVGNIKHGDGQGEKENVENVLVDKAVGAWHGARRRGFGEEGGGAPCPEEFLLREEER